MSVIAERLASLRMRKPSGIPLVVPMAGHYRRDGEFEANRNRFYADMHRVFGLEGWRSNGQTSSYKRNTPDMVIHEAKIGLRETVEINITTPFEWLVFNKRLDLKSDSMEQSRVKAGLLFRRDMLYREISGIKGPDYSGMRQLGGTFDVSAVADFRLECMESVGRLKHDMDRALFKKLEEVLIHDSWVWEGRPPSSQHAIFKTIQAALDCAAVHYGLMDLGDFRKTWPGVRYKPSSE